MADLFGGTADRHKPQTENASTHKPSKVTLIDGRRVNSDHEDWRAECEAREMLKWPRINQREFLTVLDSKRGIGAGNKVKRMMEYVEPDFVLRMATREARRAYLASVERDVGLNSRKFLEERILHLHQQRQANACTVQAK